MDLYTPGQNLAWFETLAKDRIITTPLPGNLFNYPAITWDVLRTDLIHPVCSGNKFFKLKYYLLDAIQKNHTIITTSGGAWSNHILATAFAAKACSLRSIGLIRGEESKTPSDTLAQASELGMQFRFVGRTEYKNPPTIDGYYIPAGGYGKLGVKGAAEILNYSQDLQYTHILCACGTGTMLAGLTIAAPSTRVIGVPVLKHNELAIEAGNLLGKPALKMVDDYHFGGYAKKTNDLIAFMNEFYQATGIPTDFVYTGKLMYAIKQLIQQQFFPPGSRILAIHSGGLQGNNSLKKGELSF